MQFTLSIPATSANLGPGFDSLGMALDLKDELTVYASNAAEKKPQVEVRGEFNQVPQDEKNMVFKLIRDTLDELVPNNNLHFAIKCVNNIPHARGLGSSSAAISGALAAAFVLADWEKAGRPDSFAVADSFHSNMAEIYERAVELEGHGDNVAPCIFGGLQLITKAKPGHYPILLERYHTFAFEHFEVRYLFPSTSCKTADARSALPDKIPRKLAVQNSASIAELVAAFSTVADPFASAPSKNNRPSALERTNFQGNHRQHSLRHHYPRNLNELLYFGTEDFVHQEFRREVYPESMMLVDELRKADIPAFISGAGSSVGAFWFVENHGEDCQCERKWFGREVAGRFDEVAAKFAEDHPSSNWRINSSGLGHGIEVGVEVVSNETE